QGQCNVPAPNEGFVAGAGGAYHSIGLKSDGLIVAWGYNNYGQCDVPEPNEDFVAVAAGGYFSLGLKADGSIVAWGCNGNGQCNVPAPNEGFVAVAGGHLHSLGLKANGSIVAWGFNDYGQCNVSRPNEDFVAVDGGYLHSLGLKEDGSIVAWGYNNYGQCNVPEPNEGFVAAAGGADHSLGLKEDGSIVAWGDNSLDQCNVPAPNEGCVVVAGGYWHSLGLHAYFYVIEPDSSTIWTQNETGLPVSWADDYGDTVSIILYDGAVLVDTLAASAPNTGSWVFSGPVPVSWVPGTEYMIYIEDDLGYSGWSEEFTVAPPVPIVADESAGTNNYALHNAVPNPSYGMALVEFEIPETEDVCITVFDVSGRVVTELMYSALTAGVHEAVVSDLRAGLYVVRMQAGDFIDSGRMIVVR
ncbi:MAG: T9SS type A sorting domain-containing protein, partial [Candidatus Fermentibacteraceae bacterium]|nr:T9SS type A sorting domain-containing protein [Candidatus Fermentibacteraceae bacterium]